MGCSLPGSSIHGLLQARVLEWVAMLSSSGSSQPRDRTWVSCFAGRFFTAWAIREVHPRIVRYKYWDFKKFGQFSTDEISMNAVFNLWEVVVGSKLYLLMRVWKVLLFCVASCEQSHIPQGSVDLWLERQGKLNFISSSVLFAHKKEKRKKYICMPFFYMCNEKSCMWSVGDLYTYIMAA